MFEEQPKRDVGVFLLRNILHDWSDDCSKKLLRGLRSSAQPTTKLIIVDHILPFACKAGSIYSDVPGSDTLDPNAPEPLLANLGIANLSGYLMDQMVCSATLLYIDGEIDISWHDRCL